MRFHPSTKVGEMLELRSDVVTMYYFLGLVDDVSAQIISRRPLAIRARLSGYPQRPAELEVWLPEWLGLA